MPGLVWGVPGDTSSGSAVREVVFPVCVGDVRDRQASPRRLPMPGAMGPDVLDHIDNRTLKIRFFRKTSCFLRLILQRSNTLLFRPFTHRYASVLFHSVHDFPERSSDRSSAPKALGKTSNASPRQVSRLHSLSGIRPDSAYGNGGCDGFSPNFPLNASWTTPGELLLPIPTITPVISSCQ